MRSVQRSWEVVLVRGKSGAEAVAVVRAHNRRAHQRRFIVRVGIDAGDMTKYMAICSRCGRGKNRKAREGNVARR